MRLGLLQATLLMAENQVHPALLKVFNAVGFEPPQGANPYITLKAFINFAQTHFILDQPGTRKLQEDLALGGPFADREPEITDALKQLGLLGSLSPTETSYDQTLILGATFEVMNASRFAFLEKKVWDQEIEMGNVYPLTSKRPLYTGPTSRHTRTHESQDVDLFCQKLKIDPQTIQTEEDAAQLSIWGLPKALQKRIQSPALLVVGKRSDGSRANTQDTIERWISHEGAPTLRGKKILVMTDNPFISRQREDFWNVLKKHGLSETEITIECVGYDLGDVLRPSGKNGVPDATFKQVALFRRLDNLARWIYTWLQGHPPAQQNLSSLSSDRSGD